MSATAKKLKDFVRTFSRRPDIRVITSALGPKATAADLARVRGQIPDELLSFYAAMNGAHFAWAFVEPPGCGCIQIPPLGPHTRFATDDELHTHFGEGRRAILLDAIEPECATWYLLGGALRPSDAVLWFSPSSSLSGGRIVARSLAEYIDLATASACVSWWPAPFGDIPSWIERARAAPVRPAAIRAGARVETSYYSEHARGVVREIRAVVLPQHSSLRDYGDRYALVALDEGVTLWLPVQTLKAVRGADVYEDAIARGPAFWDDLCARPSIDRIATVALAIGPIAFYAPSTGGPSNARLAAGILSPLSIESAVDKLSAAFADAVRSGVPLADPRPLPQITGEITARAWKARGSLFTPRDILEGLMAGLARKIARASAGAGVAPTAILPDRTRTALRSIPGFAKINEILAMTEPAEDPGPSIHDAEKHRAELGLEGPAAVGLGSGY